MKISQWLDEKEAEGVDVSRIELPGDLANGESPTETIFFEEYRPCSVLCSKDHAFSTVERFDHWYCSRGREVGSGPHDPEPPWVLFTRDRELALRTARSAIDPDGKNQKR